MNRNIGVDRQWKRQPRTGGEAPRQSREVKERVTLHCHVWNVNTEVVIVDPRDGSLLDAPFRHMDNAEHPVRTPSREACVEPHLEAPEVFVKIPDVVSATQKRNNGKKDMAQKKGLVKSVLNCEDGEHPH